MRLQNNIPAMRGLRSGRKVNDETAKTLEKLSSGYRINSAADDAAGLAVSEKLRVSLTGYERCEDNVREGMDLANTADAALQEVNDMLCRAKELCTRAGNGTYSEQERSHLLDELYALYDEMDRIFTGSRFNSTQLFRHEDGDYSNGTFEYLEEVIVTDSTNLQEWGALGDIDRDFDMAEPATGASVTLALDSDVKTAADLKGKTFAVKSGGAVFNVKFTDGTSANPGWDLSIGVDDCVSVQDAFDKLRQATTAHSSYWDNYHAAIESVEVDLAAGEVTITFLPGDLTQKLQNIDGAAEITYEIPGGNGDITNGIEVSSVQDEFLKQVDAADNVFSVTAEFKLLPNRLGSELLTAEDKTRLRNNTLYVNGYGITFKSGQSGSSVIDLDTISTAEELRAAVAQRIGEIKGTSASVAGDGTLTVTCDKMPSYGAYIYEWPSNGADYVNVPTAALDGIDVQIMRAAGAEQTEITVITLPDSYPSDAFSIQIKDSTYVFYNSDTLQPGYTTGSYHYDIKGKSAAEIHDRIRSLVNGQYSSDAVVTPNGNQIVVKAKAANKELGVSVSGKADSLNTYYQSDYVLLGDEDGSYNKYYRDYTVDLDIGATMGGDETNVDALHGTGFKLNGKWYQFTTDPDAEPFTDQTSQSDAELVDISGLDTYQEIADELAAVTGSSISVNGGVLTVFGTTTVQSSTALNFQDGHTDVRDGLFNETPGTIGTVLSSGGTDVTQPGASIDFSRYGSGTFRELYGKGFRVTCATCADEYINVIFCYDKANCSFPPSFDIVTASGEKRTIHNLAVELKGMKNGSDIVDAIVDQLGPELDHFTGVAAGNPSSVLEVFDKRKGDLYDVNGDRLYAEIKSGVYTNCIYNVTENFYGAPDDIVGDIEIDYRNVDIFADANGDDPYIRIHLPYLTLENLKLDPPKPDFSTPKKAMETMERVLQANNAISSMRGRLGADVNRLEHAHANLSQSQIQAADAYSRIRDADMADLLTQRTKLSILQQSQQAAQAHTLEMPQQILQLLQK